MSDDIPVEQTRSETEIARAMRLGPPPAPVVRLSRKVLLGLAGAGAIALSAALFYALHGTRHAAPPPELINTDSRQTSEALIKLPHDYTNVPRLGPPLPGDLGRPMVAAGVTPATPAGAAPAAAPPNPEAQAREQKRQRIAQEREAAKASRLFVTGEQAAKGAAPMMETAPAPAAAAEPAVAPADHRLAFLTGAPDRQTSAPDRQTIAPDRLQPLPDPNILQAGTVIPAALITGLRSDLPGQITAQVTENVYDSPTGRTLLIPQSARLIGQYDAEARFGQRRALLVWTRLILPDGRSIVLDRQPVADAQGFAGLEDQVNNHWGQIFRAALISTILGIGAQAGTGTDESALIQALRRGTSDAVSQAGRQIVGRALDIQPTLTVRPGFPVRVIVTRDLVLEPWRE